MDLIMQGSAVYLNLTSHSYGCFIRHIRQKIQKLSSFRHPGMAEFIRFFTAVSVRVGPGNGSGGDGLFPDDFITKPGDGVEAEQYLKI
jgi:hypothetical protein